MTVTAPPSSASVPALQPRLQSGLARVALGVLAALVGGLLLAVASGQLAVARVTTGSMAPAVPAGSVVVGRPVARGQLRPRDLLTAHVAEVGGTVTHRVVSVTRDGGRTLVRTKGDANPVPDTWTTVLPAEGATRVVASVPHLGHVLRRGAGGVPVLTLPLLVLVATWSVVSRLLRVLRETP